MNKAFILTVAMCLACLGAPAHATFLTLDTFTAGTTDLLITSAAPPTRSASETETGLAGVAGGSRFVEIQKLSGPSGGTRNVAAAVLAATGVLDYISGNDVTGTLKLSYDGNGTGLNTTLNAIDVLLLNFVSGDYGPTRTIPVTMTITASNDATGSLTQTLATEGAKIMEFPISGFSNLGGLNLAVNTVKKVEILFAPTAASTDFTLGTIQVVPEPSTYAMAFAGLACGGLAIWRRRQRA